MSVPLKCGEKFICSKKIDRNVKSFGEYSSLILNKKYKTHLKMVEC